MEPMNSDHKEEGNISQEPIYHTISGGPETLQKQKQPDNTEQKDYLKTLEVDQQVFFNLADQTQDTNLIRENPSTTKQEEKSLSGFLSFLSRLFIIIFALVLIISIPFAPLILLVVGSIWESIGFSPWFFWFLLFFTPLFVSIFLIYKSKKIK